MEMYILPFDHRATFVRDIFGYTEPLSKKQHSEVSKFKHIVWDAFLKVYKKQKDKKSVGILIDEEFGSKIFRKAKKLGVLTLLAAEKSGQKIFDFEYGKNFGKHILKFKPDYSKVLVRYNPANKRENKIQLKRLKKLNDFCKNRKIGFLFELLVPPSGKQKNYDRKIRPKLTVKAIKEIRKFGIEPDIWKLEAMPNRKDWQKIIEAIKYKNKKAARIIVLGRAGTKKQVKNWLKIAHSFREIIGFAVGRTIFLQPLKNYRNRKITKKQATDRIAKEFSEFIEYWKSLRVKH